MMLINHLQENQKKLQQKNRDFYTHGGLQVYFKDPIDNDKIDFEKVVAKFENIIPIHMRSEVEMIAIGWFEEFESRSINAFYDSGTLFVSNIQDNELDLFDDIVHETSHAVETVYGYQIYSDKKIEEEFLRKRKHLHDLLWTAGYKLPLSVFMETEYNKEFDLFLYETVGYDKLTIMVQGLFVSAYAPTSLREYFATGFTEFYIDSNHEHMKKMCPALYSKLILLQKEETLDNY
jgi:hypothetical protein